MNDTVTGTTMENVKNRINVKFLKNEKKYSKWMSKPRLMLQEIFDKDLVTIQEIKVTLTSNKPACVDMSILDLSKVLMYEIQYDYIEITLIRPTDTMTFSCLFSFKLQRQLVNQKLET